MAGKQAKTTPKPTDMTPLWHKSPTTAGNTPTTIKLSSMTPPMKQAPMAAQVTKTSTNNNNDKEMTDNASTTTQHIMNKLTTTNQNQNSTKTKQQPNKTIFNLWKMVAAGGTGNNSNQTGMQVAMMDPPFKLHCQIKWWNQATSKGTKGVHCQKILNILKQLQKINRMTTVYRFYSTDKNASMRLYPPLKGKVKLPPDPTGMHQYCPGQPLPEQLGYMLIRIYLGHTKTLAKILAQTTK